MDSKGRNVIVCDNGTGVSSRLSEKIDENCDDTSETSNNTIIAVESASWAGPAVSDKAPYGYQFD